jgi:hypothetical protein
MKTNMTSKSEELALDYEKSEDPAKMTYSISDFSEQDPRILPRLRELLAKNQDQDLESCEYSISLLLTTVTSGWRRLWRRGARSRG